MEVNVVVYMERCCKDVEVYSACRDELDAAAEQSKTLAKRSVKRFDDLELADDDIEEHKRRNPFLGKRAHRNPFLGKRKVNPFLGKRRNPFLGKRTADDLDEDMAEKRRMPFLG